MTRPNVDPESLRVSTGLCEQLAIDVAQTGRLRYQLLHRTVSALREARRYGAGHAMMLVHSFDRSDASLGDYQAFASAIGVMGAEADAVTSAVDLGGVSLRLAWVRDTPASTKAGSIDARAVGPRGVRGG